jgi:mannose-1-phosphate guanylyltransferase
MKAPTNAPTKAMILAAGLGTRLRPLTDTCPKALVRVGGCTLLEITLARLRDFGVRDVIVNVHHCADMLVDYLKANGNFGMNIEVSREDVLLDTGGGLKKAAHFFLDTPTLGAPRPDRTAQRSGLTWASSDAPFILHNVDVISTIDLQRMIEFHTEHHALATLAVQERDTSRYLLFDQQLQLCGRRAGRDLQPEIVRPAPQMQPLAFSGIHVISPRLLQLLTEDGVFSIIPAYLRLAAQGEKILAFRADEYCWRDLGKPGDLAQAEQDLQNQKFHEEK